jgi:hypothetical protein
VQRPDSQGLPRLVVPKASLFFRILSIVYSPFK